MSISENTLILNGKYRVLEKLDEGRYGHVYKIKNTQTKQIYALKSISKMDMKKNTSLRRNLGREIYIHKQLDHPNIVKLIETGESKSRMYIILEYMDLGDVFDLMYNYLSTDSTTGNAFSEDESRDYFYQLIQALIYLRDLNILHRDLKPENILISSNGQIKLADFGWAIDKPSNENVGTTRYSSPEMIFDKHKYNYKTDVWSTGIILYEFLYGTTPYESRKESKVEAKIEKIFFKFPENSTVSDLAKDLIRKILIKNPDRRPDYEEILAHEWMKPALNQNIDNLDNLELEDDSEVGWDSEYNNEVEVELNKLRVEDVSKLTELIDKEE